MTESFADHPVLTIWELTRACDLKCKHCRAEAQTEAEPDELTTQEGIALMAELAAAKVPLLVLTGGDPAKRADLLELLSVGKSLGLTMGLTPSVTPLLTNHLLEQLKEAGLSRLAVSLDGASEASHDSFRGQAGAFRRTIEVLQVARSLGLATQVNTSIHPGNEAELEDVFAIAEREEVRLLSAFFVIPTGRAKGKGCLGAAEVESLLHRLADRASCSKMGVKTTAAPHYRRILLERKRGAEHGVYGRDALRINEGRGFAFVSRRGDVMPSGFLPIVAGSVRKERFIDIYRSAPLLRALRDEDKFSGKCGVCPYRRVCGGSRARAYADSGDPLGSDPACSYMPEGYQPERGVRRLEWIS